jgi:hypothetical protein
VSNRSTEDGTPLLLAVAAVIVLTSLKGCGDLDVNPKPRPNVTTSGAFDSYRQLMAETWRDGASRLDRGELTTDRAAHDWIEERARLARQPAFAPIHAREQDTLGDGKWSSEANSGLWREFADESEMSTNSAKSSTSTKSKVSH